ncbi:MAG: recombination protein RecR [Deltaproteobacteria bacterium]|nr:recombination protein RecR [Deltaproteobacteria bacterium]MBW2113134.1 recombination protein RecR [Deltaproteobacteria bacterium]MBW2351826.1 recombination protein RecR [Deltaproteobacteria bacterium]HDZ89252.1 recombination protein RecR [Deltaproteobacteria bacterium]
MGIYPPSLEKLIAQFSRLPGIGQKSATRMALHVLRSDRDLAEGLARSLVEVKERIRFCSICFNLTDDDPCPICTDDNRANGSVCVVEGPGDQLAIEEAGIFKGRYHVLHGVLSPLDGIGPEDLRIGKLLARIQGEKVREVILATNPTTAGEATASFLARLLLEKAPEIRITRIAMGVPMGGDLKYMDRMTLEHALKSRIPVDP